jgi:hypothetical protein
MHIRCDLMQQHRKLDPSHAGIGFRSLCTMHIRFGVMQQHWKLDPSRAGIGFSSSTAHIRDPARHRQAAAPRITIHA